MNKYSKLVTLLEDIDDYIKRLMDQRPTFQFILDIYDGNSNNDKYREFLIQSVFGREVSNNYTSLIDCMVDCFSTGFEANRFVNRVSNNIYFHSEAHTSMVEKYNFLDNLPKENKVYLELEKMTSLGTINIYLPLPEFVIDGILDYYCLTIQLH